MPTLNIPIAASADDGFSYGTFDNSFVTINVGKTGGVNTRTFMRFLSVAIPVGAVINSAILTLVQSARYSTAGRYVVVKGNDVDDAVAPTNDAENNALVATTATVNFTPAAVFSAGSDEDTPDLKTIIQEIVNRAGWASGNDIQILIDNGNADDAIVYASWDHASYNPPELTIDYTPAIVPYVKHLYHRGHSRLDLTKISRP